MFGGFSTWNYGFRERIDKIPGGNTYIHVNGTTPYTYNGNTIFQFDGKSGALTFSNVAGNIPIRILAVGGGGGGGGGYYNGGGGGGGGVFYTDSYLSDSISARITVGDGGMGGQCSAIAEGGTSGTNGGNTALSFNYQKSLTNITAYGGGGGATDVSSGLVGGSSGGAGYSITVSTPGNTSASNFASAGGKYVSGTGAAGGGGAGQAGLDAITGQPANGGSGYLSQITGASLYWGGGGGGGINSLYNSGYTGYETTGITLYASTGTPLFGGPSVYSPITNKIYIFPFTNTVGFVIVYNIATNTYTTVSVPTYNTFANAVYAPNTGKIYTIAIDPGPLATDQSWNMLVFNTNDNSSYRIQIPRNGSNESIPWENGEYVSYNQTICYIPRADKRILIIDTLTDALSYITITTISTDDFAGCVYSPISNLVYGVPYNSYYVSTFNVITNVYTRTAITHGLGFGNFLWTKGVYGNNGKIYCFPANTTKILVIDTTTNTVSQPVGLNIGAGKVRSGVVSPYDNKIYCSPYQSDASMIVIDTTANTYAQITYKFPQIYAYTVIDSNYNIYSISSSTINTLNIAALKMKSLSTPASGDAGSGGLGGGGGGAAELTARGTGGGSALVSGSTGGNAAVAPYFRGGNGGPGTGGGGGGGCNDYNFSDFLSNATAVGNWTRVSYDYPKFYTLIPNFRQTAIFCIAANYISFGTQTTYDYSAGTYEIWYRRRREIDVARTEGQYAFLIGKVNGFAIILDTDLTQNKILAVHYPGGAQTTAITANIPTDYAWFHVALTYNSGSTATLYVNGVAQGTATMTLYAQDTPVRIGSSTLNTARIHFANARIWNTIRTAQDISNNRFKIMQGGEALGLVGSFPLNMGETIVNYATISGGNGGSGTSIISIPSVNIKEYKYYCCELAGTTYIQYNFDAINTPAIFTLEGCVKTSGGTGIKGLLSINATSGLTEPCGFYLNNNQLNLVWGATTQSIATTITDNVWHHLSIKCSGVNINAYVDGQLVASITSTYTLSIVNTYLYAGSITLSSVQYFYTGRLYNVRLWNYVRAGFEDAFVAITRPTPGLIVSSPLNEMVGTTTLYNYAESPPSSASSSFMGGTGYSWVEDAPSPTGLKFDSVAINSFKVSYNPLFSSTQYEILVKNNATNETVSQITTLDISGTITGVDTSSNLYNVYVCGVMANGEKTPQSKINTLAPVRGITITDIANTSFSFQFATNQNATQYQTYTVPETTTLTVNPASPEVSGLEKDTSYQIYLVARNTNTGAISPPVQIPDLRFKYPMYQYKFDSSDFATNSGILDYAQSDVGVYDASVVSYGTISLPVMATPVLGINNTSYNYVGATGLYTFQNGQYDISFTSYDVSYSNFLPSTRYASFDNSNNTLWSSGYRSTDGYTQRPYNTTTGAYVGGGTSKFWTTDVQGVGTVSGEWLQIKLPYKLKMTRYQIGYNNIGIKWREGPLYNTSTGIGVCVSKTGQVILVCQLGGISISTNYGVSYTSYGLGLDIVRAAISGDGTYLLLNDRGSSTTPGGIYRATLATPTNRTLVGYTGSTGERRGSHFYSRIEISYTGQYQFMAVNGILSTEPNGGIKYSTDYGVTWTRSNAPSEGWRCISCSENAQYVAAAVDGGNIYESTDYGVNWTAITSAGSRSWRIIKVSSTGQYQICCVWNSGIFYSTNYGVSWSQSDAPVMTWVSNTLSMDGKKAVAVASNSYYIYVSYNSGANWSAIYVNAPLYTTNQSPTWDSVSMSASGDYVVAGAVNLADQQYAGRPVGVFYATTREMPQKYRIVGSNDGTTWNQLDAVNQTTFPSSTMISVNNNVSSTTSYSYFRIITESTFENGGGFVGINNFDISGDFDISGITTNTTNLITTSNPAKGTGSLSLSASTKSHLQLQPFTTTTDSSGMTIAFWIKGGADASNATLFDFATNTSGANRISSKLISGKPTFWVGDVSGTLSQSIITDANKWNHFAWLIDNTGKWIVYQNGLPIQNVISGFTLPPTLSRTVNYIGRNVSDTTMDFTATVNIDEFRMWNSNISIPELLYYSSTPNPLYDPSGLYIISTGETNATLQFTRNIKTSYYYARTYPETSTWTIVDASSLLVPGLTEDKYNIYLTGYNNVSKRSNTLAVSLLSRLSSLAITSTTDVSATIQYTSPSGSNKTVFYTYPPTTTVETTDLTTATIDFGSNTNTTYTVYGYAFNTDTSAISLVSKIALLPAPNTLYATLITETSVKLQYSSVVGATAYNISTSPATTLATTSDLSYLFVGLTPGTEYTFYVAATNSGTNQRSLAKTHVVSTFGSTAYYYKMDTLDLSSATQLIANYKNTSGIGMDASGVGGDNAVYDASSLVFVPNTLVVPTEGIISNPFVYSAGIGSNAYRNGTYDVSASTYDTVDPNSYLWGAFDNVFTTYWKSGAAYDANGDYIGTTTTVANGSQNIAGEWVQLKLPYSGKLVGYTISAELIDSTTLPKTFYVVGSNDGATWTSIDYMDIPITVPEIVKTTGIFSSTYYNYFRIITNKTFGGSNASMGRWDIYVDAQISPIDTSSFVYGNASLGLKNGIVGGVQTNNSRIQLPPLTVSNGTGMAVSYWMKTDASFGTIFDIANSDATYTMSMRLTDNGVPTFYMYQGSAVYSKKLISPVADNSWNHFVWNIDTNGKWTSYINGLYYDPSFVLYPASSIRGNVFLGYDASNSVSSNFNMDEFRLWNKPIDDKQATLLYYGKTWVSGLDASNLSIAIGSITDTSAIVQYDTNANATSYEIRTYPSVGAPIITTAGSCEINGLVNNGTRYNVYVSGLNSSGGRSNTKYTTIYEAPATLSVIDVSNTTATITYSPVVGANNYIVKYTNNLSTISTVSVAGTSYAATDFGSVPNKVSVYAGDKGDNIFVKSDTVYVAAPSNFQVLTTTETYADISFTLMPGVSYYEVDTIPSEGIRIAYTSPFRIDGIDGIYKVRIRSIQTPHISAWKTFNDIISTISGITRYYKFDAGDIVGNTLYNSATVSYDASLVAPSIVPTINTTVYKKGTGSLQLVKTNKQYVSLPSFTNSSTGFSVATWVKAGVDASNSSIFDYTVPELNTDSIFLGSVPRAIGASSITGIPTNNAITYEIWVKATDWATVSYSSIITNGFQTFLKQTTTDIWPNFPGNRSDRFTLPFSLNANVWYHYAVVLKGYVQNGCSIYLNGIRVGYSTIAAVAAGSTLSIGSTLYTQVPPKEAALNLFFDQFRMWNYERSPQQILDAYNRRYYDTTGLICYLPMNEGTGTRLYNQVSGGTDLSSNAQWTASAPISDLSKNPITPYSYSIPNTSVLSMRLVNGYPVVSGGGKSYTIPVSIVDNSWNHLAWTIDNTGTWTVYLNGLYYNTNIISSPQLLQRTLNCIGKFAHDESGNNTSNLYLDDYREFTKVLDMSYVNMLYNGTKWTAENLSPTNLQITDATSTSISFTFNANPSATSYIIRTSPETATTTTTSTSITLSGLTISPVSNAFSVYVYGQDANGNRAYPVKSVDTLSLTTAYKYPATISFAGSTRLFVIGYTGPIFKLRRSTDNSMQDFYTDATQSYITTGANNTGTAYTDWIGAGTAYITILYNQNGSSNHARNIVNDATQPLFTMKDNKYTIQFVNTSNTFLTLDSAINPYTIFTQFWNSNTTYGTIACHTNTTQTGIVDFGMRFSPNTALSIDGSGNYGDWYYNCNGTKLSYVNGVSANTLGSTSAWKTLCLSSTQPINTIGFKYIGRDGSTNIRQINGYMTDFVFHNREMTASMIVDFYNNRLIT